MIFDNNIPIYQQIMEILKQRILNQEIKPGELIPSVRTLAIELNVTTNTVQRAYTEMVEENLLKPVRGVGNKVTGDQKRINNLRKKYSTEKIKKMYEDLKKIGTKDDDFQNLIQEFLNQVKSKSLK